MQSSKKKNLITLKKLFQYTKPYKVQLYSAAILAIILAPLNAYIPFLANQMVDGYILKNDPLGLQKMAILFLLVLILITVSRYFFIILTI